MKTRKGIPLSIPFPIGRGRGVKQVYEELNLGGNGSRPRKVELDASYSYVRAVYVISRCWSVSTPLLRQANAEISAFSQEMPVDSDAEKRRSGRTRGRPGRIRAEETKWIPRIVSPEI